MKKAVKIGLLFMVFMGVVTPVSAQIENFVGAWAQGGEYSYLSNVNGVLQNGRPFALRSSLGGGGGLGVMYEMRAGRHFLLDAGIGFNTSWTQFRTHRNDTSFMMPNQSDSISGLSFNYQYDLSNRRDAYLSTSLQVPLMIGGQWGNFYFLAGAKLDLPLATRSIININMDAHGYDKMTNMLLPDTLCKGFVSGYPLKTKKDSIKIFTPDVNLTAEIGFRLGKVYKERGYDVPDPAVQYRLALFAEVGVLNVRIKPNDDVKPIYGKIPGYTYGNFDFSNVLTDVMNSKEAEEAGYPPKVVDGEDYEGGNTPAANLEKPVSTTFFRSFMIGLKFTVLIRMPEKKIRRVYYDVPYRSSYGILE